MARDFIKINTADSAATRAVALKQFNTAFRQVYEQAKREKAIMDHNTDGTVWTDLEALYGLPAGKGDDVYNMVAGAIAAIEGTAQTADGRTFTEQVG